MSGLTLQDGTASARGPGARVVDLGTGRLALSVLRLAENAGEWPCIRSFEARRRREHQGGRAALRAALAALGVPAGPLTRQPDGAPEAPPGARVTVTHRYPYAAAAAWTAHRARRDAAGRAGRAQVLGLGIDIENAGSVPASALHLLCRPRELVRARRSGAVLRDATRLFSAKEAVFKAVPKSTGHPFRPRELPLRWLDDASGLYEGTGSARPFAAFVTTRQVGERWIALCVALG